MKKYLLLILLSSSALAKVDPRFQELRDSKIRCDVVSAVQYKNDVLEKKMSGSGVVMETFIQDGGSGYVDAMCFVTPAVNRNGEKVSISFGCLPLESKYVRTFTDEKLKLKRNVYNEVVEINFETGVGTHSFNNRSCDWGRECVKSVGRVEFRNCIRF